MTALAPDGPLWWWLHNGHHHSQYTLDSRQAGLDVLEVGARPTAWLGKPHGGIDKLTGYRPAGQLPPELVDALARIEASPPNTRRPRLRAVP